MSERRSEGDPGFTRSWMRDQGRQGKARVNEIAEQARVKGVALDGTLPAAGKVYRHVLREWRAGRASRSASSTRSPSVLPLDGGRSLSALCRSSA
jgi:hypothetical protein